MGKTVIVTGGASGIGRATCFRFAEEGYNVVVADVQKDPREGGPRTHEKLKSDGHDARFWETDVRKWEEVQELVGKTLEWYGNVDVLVNNAGFAEMGRIEEMDLDDVYRIFRVNIDGVFHGMRAVVPHMRENGAGSIVNVSSGAGKKGVSHGSAYCGSKFAVIGTTEAVAAEVEEDGVTVNAVCPGRTATAMTGFEGVPPEQVAETVFQAGMAERTGAVFDT